MSYGNFRFWRLEKSGYLKIPTDVTRYSFFGYISATPLKTRENCVAKSTQWLRNDYLKTLFYNNLSLTLQPSNSIKKNVATRMYALS